jgi:hypothetical protein
MGLIQSNTSKYKMIMSLLTPTRKHTNYDCANCRQTNDTPNMLGKFNIINESEYKCNSCNTIFVRKNCNTCKKLEKIPNSAESYFIIPSNNECLCQ